MRLSHRILTGLASAAALALAAAPALADPALWVVKSKDAKVYLFGTVHLLPPAMKWRTPALEKAMSESQELWLEIALGATPTGSGSALTPEQMKSAQALMAKLAINTGAPLTSQLTPTEVAQLSKLAAAIPVPMAAVDRMRPWMAATLVSMAQTRELGWTEPGPDIKLDQDAVANGKPVKGFETLEQQAHFLADMAPDQELAFLRQSLADASEDKAQTEKLGHEWAAGDDKAMAKTFVSDLKTKYPTVYQRLLVQRNRTWVPQIETLLKTPGVRFVAVGEGHLLGPDGVPALLKADGYGVERVH